VAVDEENVHAIVVADGIKAGGIATEGDTGVGLRNTMELPIILYKR
jgi:hypothetical protein